MNVDVGICTFRRDSLYETLESLAAQNIQQNLAVRVIVADNDEQPVKKSEIVAQAQRLGLNLAYVHAPARNISIARNACLDNSEAEYLLFIDDDEIADSNWITGLLETATQKKANIVFGPVHAVYPPGAPDWMRDNKVHSSVPSALNGTVETGFSGNVLLNRREARLRDARFSLDFGRTGGEDIDFFFRLHRSGVPMAISTSAIVHEPVDPSRLSFEWLWTKSMATGTIYGFCARQGQARKTPLLLAKSFAKASYCGLRAVLSAANKNKWTFWALRGGFHYGVLKGCFKKPNHEFYGR